MNTEKENINIHGSLWTVSELSAYLKVSTDHVYKLVGNRNIPFVRVGGAIRFRRGQIDEWLDTRSSFKVRQRDGKNVSPKRTSKETKKARNKVDGYVGRAKQEVLG